METAPQVPKSSLEGFTPNSTKNAPEMLETLLWKSTEFTNLVHGIESAQSFEEVNKLIEVFNKGVDAKFIGNGLKKMKEGMQEAQRDASLQNEGFSQPIYIEKKDGKSIQKIMAHVRFHDGKLEVKNGMKADGSFTGAFE
jgi:hypothetical protein